MEAFQTSESWETGSVAVVFGSREGILHIMQAAHHYSVNTGLQWLFVLLDMPRELSSFGMCSLSYLPIEQGCQTCGSQSFIMWPTHFLTYKIFHSYCKQLFPILNVKQSHLRPGEAMRVLLGSGSRISKQSAQEDSKVVSPKHLPP